MSINRILDQDVQQIKRDLDLMIVDVKLQYQDTYKALADEDYDLAQKVILGHKKIIAMQDNFINMALWKIAKQGMVASDLRLAIGSILIVREITKIAEYARNIARYLDFFKPKAAQTEQLKTTFKFLIEMIDLIQALINHYDTDLSARVIQINKDITQDFQSAKKGMISKIREADSDDDAMILYSSLRQIKALEKAGDHILNIQEILTFIRNGSFDETPSEDWINK